MEPQDEEALLEPMLLVNQAYQVLVVNEAILVKWVNEVLQVMKTSLSVEKVPKVYQVMLVIQVRMDLRAILANKVFKELKVLSGLEAIKVQEAHRAIKVNQVNQVSWAKMDDQVIRDPRASEDLELTQAASVPLDHQVWMVHQVSQALQV